MIEEGFELFGVIEWDTGFSALAIPGGGLIEIEGGDEGRAALFLWDDGATDVALFIDQDNSCIVVPFTGHFIGVGVCLEFVFDELVESFRLIAAEPPLGEFHFLGGGGLREGGDDFVCRIGIDEEGNEGEIFLGGAIFRETLHDGHAAGGGIRVPEAEDVDGDDAAAQVCNVGFLAVLAEHPEIALLGDAVNHGGPIILGLAEGPLFIGLEDEVTAEDHDADEDEGGIAQFPRIADGGFENGW